MNKDGRSAASTGADSGPHEPNGKTIALLLNRLVLMVSAMATQEPGLPLEGLAEWLRRFSIDFPPSAKAEYIRWASEVEALRQRPGAQAASEPVAEVVSWTNGSYSRNYTLRWLRDVPEGAKLYAAPAGERPAQAEPGLDEVIEKVGELDPRWNAYGASRSTAVALAVRALKLLLRDSAGPAGAQAPAGCARCDGRAAAHGIVRPSSFHYPDCPHDAVRTHAESLAAPSTGGAETAAQFVLSDVDPVVIAAWRLQGRKVGAMLSEAQAAVIELTDKLDDGTSSAPASSTGGAETAALYGFDRENLEAVAEGLAIGYEASINIGNTRGEGDEHIESTTAYAARFIRTVLASSAPASSTGGAETDREAFLNVIDAALQSPAASPASKEQ